MTTKPTARKPTAKPHETTVSAPKVADGSRAPQQEKKRIRGRSVGRPTLFKREYVEVGRRLALLGLTNDEMARFFNVGATTFDRWLATHAEFRCAVNESKAVADGSVASRLFERAIGSTYTETSEVQDATGSVVSRTVDTKHLPANVTAQIFWLKNRQPDKWRDRIEHQADVTLNTPDAESLYRLYEENMRQARERQQAVLRERGLITDEGGCDDA